MIISCAICSGQNLVPNPSFEDTISCPDTLGQVWKAVGWNGLRGSPDYFNVCAPASSGSSSIKDVSVPLNFWGYQQPASGNAYAGAACRYGPGDIREYIGAPLISPMQVGTKYYISVKLCLALDGHPLICGINKVGFLFSTIIYSPSNPPPICNCSQVFTNNIITDTLNWTTFKSSFIADSNYSFVSIGNFFVDSLTDSIQIQGPLCDAYYYFDDVCISTDSLTCYSPVGVNEVKNESEISLFPNPFTDKINITIKRNELLEVSLYDITSRKMLQQQFTNDVSLNTEQLAKGLYICEVRNKNGVIKQGKVVKD